MYVIIDITHHDDAQNVLTERPHEDVSSLSYFSLPCCSSFTELLFVFEPPMRVSCIDAFVLPV